jgi:hypothetical protein
MYQDQFFLPGQLVGVFIDVQQKSLFPEVRHYEINTASIRNGRSV